MMRFLLIPIFLSLTTLLPAQIPNQNNKWTASLTGAFLPLPDENFGIQPGLKYNFDERFSLVTEVTIKIGSKDDADKEAINKKYFRIQPELRYNLINKKRKRQDYTGLRISYATRKFEDINGGFYATKYPGDDGFFYDRAKINSPVFTSSIQYGTLLAIGNKYSFDLFVGLGVRAINTEYTDVANPIMGSRSRAADGPGLYASYSYNENVLWLHMNAGFRFNWHFM